MKKNADENAALLIRIANLRAVPPANLTTLAFGLKIPASQIEKIVEAAKIDRRYRYAL